MLHFFWGGVLFFSKILDNRIVNPVSWIESWIVTFLLLTGPVCLNTCEVDSQCSAMLNKTRNLFSRIRSMPRRDEPLSVVSLISVIMIWSLSYLHKSQVSFCPILTLNSMQLERTLQQSAHDGLHRYTTSAVTTWPNSSVWIWVFGCGCVHFT